MEDKNSFEMELVRSSPVRLQKDWSFSFHVKRELEDVNSHRVICFKNPTNNMILTCSKKEQVIRIFSEELNLIGTISDSNPINDIIQMNEKTLIACFSASGKRGVGIKSYKLSSKIGQIFELEREMDCVKRYKIYDVIRMLKLSNQFYVCRCIDGRVSGMSILLLMDFWNSSISTDYYVGYLRPETFFPMLVSKNYPNSFYVPTQDSRSNVIKLIDIQQNLVTKEFRTKNGFAGPWFFAFSVFRNSKKDEILIACDTILNIFFFCTSDKKFETDKYIQDRVNAYREDRNTPYNLHNKKITACCFCMGKYLVCGTIGDGCTVFEVEENEDGEEMSFELSILVVNDKRIHGDWVCEMRSFFDDESKVLSVSTDRTMKLSGIKHDVSYFKEDLKERLKFLIDRKDKYLFCNYDERMIVYRTFRIKSHFFDVEEEKGFVFRSLHKIEAFLYDEESEEDDYFINRPINEGGMKRKKGEDEEEEIVRKFPLKKRKLNQK